MKPGESISCLSAQDMVERETIAALSHNLRSDNRFSGEEGWGLPSARGVGRGTSKVARHAVQIAKQAASAGLVLGFVFTWIGGVACRVIYSFPLVLTLVWVKR